MPFHGDLQVATNTAPFTPLSAAAPRLSTLRYRSRSVKPMSELELYRLMRSAQLRNEVEGVTSLMVYDKGWIFQHLEGPAEGLARIWKSISQDGRHADIEILDERSAAQRQFEDHGLKLAVYGAKAGQSARDLADLPSERMNRYYLGDFGASLQPSAGPVPTQPRPATRETLTRVLEQVIIPHLTVALPPMALARLLIAPDQAPAIALVKAAHDIRHSLEWLTAELLEPSARRLGDLWLADDCSELDVSLALVRLQSIVRKLGEDAPVVTAAQAPVVLVVPQPGEIHLLGTTLDAEMLWRAGWNPQVDFPNSSGALDDLLANTWVDALDLSMSTVFGREHRMAQLGETIAHARLASMNPNLVVVVSGRAFVSAGTDAADDAGAAGRGVGADASFGSAVDAELTIMTALHLPSRR